METTKIEWHNPHKKLWGFHVHQELPLDDFAKALVTQMHCAEFLKENNIPIDNDDVLKPGYGPHLEYMWELRIETATENILEKLGLAISYMAINRFGLSAYIHPLMQDPSLPEEEAFVEEGRYNQANALWFSYRVKQNQDFFFNPPKDHQNKIIDTRTPRIFSEDEKNTLRNVGKKSLHNQFFHSPSQIIINGFHIHMDFSENEAELALIIFDKFLIFLIGENMRPTSTRIYDPYSNGPHIQGGWEVKFEMEDEKILAKIGVAIGWLMCNRQGISVFMHPVTWREGDDSEELKAHEEYSFFLGHMPMLDLSFFSKKIAKAESK